MSSQHQRDCDLKSLNHLRSKSYNLLRVIVYYHYFRCIFFRNHWLFFSSCISSFRWLSLFDYTLYFKFVLWAACPQYFQFFLGSLLLSLKFGSIIHQFPVNLLSLSFLFFKNRTFLLNCIIWFLYIRYACFQLCELAPGILTLLFLQAILWGFQVSLSHWLRRWLLILNNFQFVL